MANLFQYARGASGQTAGIMAKPTSGLNEYLPSNAINDNLMSSVIDVFPYRDECIKFYADSSITQLGASITAGKGSIRACINSDESTFNVDVFYLMSSWDGLWKLIRHTYTHSTGVTAISEFTFAYDSIVPADASLVDSSSAIFKTEADTYYVFSNTHEKRLHFIKHTSTTNTYGYVDIPAFPKKLVAHANRIFFIDTANKLWWCRAGDLYSWYSMEFDPDAIFPAAVCANSEYTIVAQPNVARPLTATVVKVDALDTLGTLTIVGTNSTGEPITAELTLMEGRVQTSMAFKTITSITQSGWVIGGTARDTISVGVAPVGLGFVTDDAGYWTMEQELFLNDLCILGGSMYIFADHDIYVFQGYSPDNFSLQRIIADTGIERMQTPNGYSKLVTGHNNAYFIYDGFVYEFNGNNRPVIISRPSSVNGQSANGIFGGINFSGESWVLSSLSELLCLYDYTGTYAYYYLYNFETKTWWKMSGILKEDISSTYAIKTMYVPDFDRQSWHTFLSINSTVKGYVLVGQQGCTQSSVNPFVISKSYNTNPSETGSLTEVILLVKGTLSDTADIKLQYSLSVDADDFVDIKEYNDYIFNGDLEIISIPVPIANIANAHHYRIKLIVGNFSGTNGVYLYNIERRFRTKGRSR